MEIDITDAPAGIEIGAEGIKEIIQNVRTIIRTVIGTVPLDRGFGLDQDFIDAPIPVSRALFMADVVQAVHKYEPRVEVVKVFWINETVDIIDGKQTPTVRIKIREDIVL